MSIASPLERGFILETRYGKRPDRLLLYGRRRKADAIMEFPYRPELVEEAGRYFDEVVMKIQARDFQVVKSPERKICKECDLKAFCTMGGLISDPDATEAGPSRVAMGAGA